MRLQSAAEQLRPSQHPEPTCLIDGSGNNYSTKGTLKTLEVLEEKLKDGDTLPDC